jgi:adenylylsulfate kinase
MRSLTNSDRSLLNGHQPVVLWFTGLSASGQSTIANLVENRLFHDFQAHTYVLDGDIIRTGLNKDLDFSDAGRKENIRRIAEVTKLFFDAGLIILTTFISPFRTERDFARSLIPSNHFIEIYVSCPLNVCEERDSKGLYKKARAGLIKNYTGIDSPYEPPINPELVLESAVEKVQDCADKVIQFLIRKQILKI